MKKICVICFIVVLLFGCATIPEPTAVKNTLLIGQVIQTGKGFGSSSNMFNGTHKKGIKITVQNTGTNRDYFLNTNYDGTFVSADITNGEYVIKTICIEIQESGRGAGTCTHPDPDSQFKSFSVIEGKVNNLGIIDWIMVYGKKHNLMFNKEYDEFRDFFSARYAGSAWLEKEWVQVNVHR